MANPRGDMRFEHRDDVREHQFKQVWNEELIDVFADVAKYYDRANRVASLGLWGWFRRSFLSTMELRPGNKVVEELYYAYLRMCLTLMAWLFRSGPAAVNCKDYIIETLQLFYSANEFSQLLRQVGFRQISSKTVLSGMVGFHKAVKETNP